MGPLGFLSPVFLIGALAALAPVLLHLMKRTPGASVPFPALRLIRPEHAPRARRQRLERLLLLFLRASALVLLAVAFARPYFAGEAAAAGTPLTVIAVDRSFSLSAPGQFDRARRLARQAAEAASGEVALVAFSDEADLIVPPTADRGRLLAEVDGLEPGAGGTRYRPALARSSELHASRGGRVVLITDLQRGGWRGDGRLSLPHGLEVIVRDVGSPAGNLACIDLYRAGSGLEAVVRNFATSEVATRVRLVIDGRTVATERVSLQPGEARQVAFERVLPRRGVAAAVADDEAGFEADNARYLVLDPPAPIPVLLVAGGAGPSPAEALYVDRALRVDDERLFDVSVAVAGEIAVLGDGLSRYAAAVLLAPAGLGAGGRAALAGYAREGGGILIVAGEGTDPEVVRELVGASPTPRRPTDAVGLVPAERRHPILRALASAGAAGFEVRVNRMLALGGEAMAGQAVLRFGDGSPALVERAFGSGRILWFGSDLANRWNDLPLQPLFLPLLHEMVRYVTTGREPSVEYTVADVPAGVAPRPGVAELRAGAAAAGETRAAAMRRVAVNVDTAESDLDRMSPQEFNREVEAARTAVGTRQADASARVEDEQRWWRYGLLLVLLTLAAEGFVARRVA